MSHEPGVEAEVSRRKASAASILAHHIQAAGEALGPDAEQEIANAIDQIVDAAVIKAVDAMRGNQ